MKYFKYFSRLWPEFFLFLCIALPANADVPNHVAVRKLSYAGSACPAGISQGRISNETLIFTPPGDLFFAEVGTNIPFRNRRRNCQLVVDLDYPKGWTYSLYKVSYRSKIKLDSGVQGLYQTTYYFSGQVPTAVFQSLVVGPVASEASDVIDGLPDDRLLWSPCDKQRSLSINTEIRLENAATSSGHGLMQMISTEGAVKIIYAMKWRRCS